MKKSKKISLSLNKKVVSNLQSNEVKGGTQNPSIFNTQCNPCFPGGGLTEGCGPLYTGPFNTSLVVNGCQNYK